jgi:hypothetical protein
MPPYCESLFMPFVLRLLDPSTSRRQPDGFPSARGASGLTRAAIRASHGAAPPRRAALRVSPRRRRPLDIRGCDTRKNGRGKRNSQAAQQISSQSRAVVLCLFLHRGPGGPIVDLLNRGVSVVGIAAREDLTAKRSRPEMAPQRLEKIVSAPGNGMVAEDSNPQDLVHGRAAGRARFRLTSRKNDKVA